MDDNKEYKETAQIETVQINCKIEIEEQTVFKVERDSDTDDDGSYDDLQSNDNSSEISSQNFKRKKSNENGNKKIKIEECVYEDDIEEVQSSDPLELNVDQKQDHQHFTCLRLNKQLPGDTGHTYRRSALVNSLKLSKSGDNHCESDNDIDNNIIDSHDNDIDNSIIDSHDNDIDNYRIDSHDNQTAKWNRKMPEKYYKKFLEVHDAFNQFMKRMKVPYIFEDCVLTYFRELAKNYKPMSLWKLFTMLRYVVLCKDNIDIKNYSEVTQYLSELVCESERRSTAAAALGSNDVRVFMDTAPDYTYLGTKVALLLGVSGGCNCQELLNLTVDNVRRYGTIILVKLKDTNKKNRTFIIPDNYHIHINKYINLRPRDMKNNVFLLHFKDGKYTRSAMSKLLVRSVPKDVASYLKISNADEYTGHYLKRTAFVLFNLTTLSITNDSDDSDNEYESDNHNDIDNQVDNFDNKDEKSDKIKVIDNKRPANVNVNIKRNYNEIDKSSNNNAIDICDLDEDFFEITPYLDQCDIDNNKPGWHPKYDQIYNYFIRWSKDKSTDTFSEDVILTYFKELSDKFEPSTLWSQYYVLKRTLIIKNNVDITEYDELRDFLKKKADGFSLKSRVFTIKQINDFLEKAPDEIYLHWKVALILGIKGSCKCTELLTLTAAHVQLTGDLATVTVPEARNRKRKFFVAGQYLPYLKTYVRMRPPNCKTDKFLLLIKNKKVIKACVGKNTLNAMPREIANYLNLPFPEEYNGHCFRSTSMTLFRCDALLRSQSHAGQLSQEGVNVAQNAVAWPKDDGQRALCWPLMIESDDQLEASEANKVLATNATNGMPKASETNKVPETNEAGRKQWTLNSENGIFEIAND